MGIDIWGPGACFARAKVQVGKLAWYSRTERMVILLDLQRKTLSPRYNKDHLNWLVGHGVGEIEFVGSAWSMQLSLSHEERWLRFMENWAKDPNRKKHNEHMLDFLYVKFLDDKIKEEVFRVQDDPFWSGRLIL